MARFISLRGHTILASGVSRGGLVIDAGSHRGEFARAMAERFASEVGCDRKWRSVLGGGEGSPVGFPEMVGARHAQTQHGCETKCFLMTN